MKKILMLLGILSLCSCGYKDIPRAKNNVEAEFAKVQSQYKRRLDLIPSLVKVVKAYAGHEKDTLEAVISARAKATSITVDASTLTPEKARTFNTGQSELSSALGRLMIVSERYPQLKADKGFQDLQVQLEGTENRINYARGVYIESIRQFNDLVTVFPTSLTNKLFFKFEKMPQWTMSDDEQKKAEKAPEIDL